MKITIIFLLYFVDTPVKLFSQSENSIIISVGNNPITRVDLIKEIKLIAILSNTEINKSNREQIKGLAVKALIKRNIKESEIKRRNIYKYNQKQLNGIIKNTSLKLGVDQNGLKEILKKNNLSFEELVKRFETDLKWNYMIFQIYKNKISLNTAEIENKIQLRLNTMQSSNDQEKIVAIKEKVVNEEKEKKLKMFSNMHFQILKDQFKLNF